MAEAFPTVAGGLLQGVQTGMQLGQSIRQTQMQREQLAMQKNQQAEAARQAQWEKGYKTAALSIQTADLLKNSPELQARVLNNGFLALWNNPEFDVEGNNKAMFQPFTPDDMQDKDVQDVIKKSKEYATNKDMQGNPELQKKAVVGLWMDYHAKRGNKAEAQKLALELASGDPDAKKEVFAGGDTLRKEFISQTKDFATIASAMRKIDAAADLQTPQGDMSLIFAYMKALDPGSTVREGEYATAEQTRGLPANIVAYYNKALDGQKLTPDQRMGFVQAAGDLYDSQEGGLTQLENDYTEKAKRRNVNPADVIVQQRYQRKKRSGEASEKPKTIQQGGFTYTINEKTGQYE